MPKGTTKKYARFARDLQLIQSKRTSILTELGIDPIMAVPRPLEDATLPITIDRVRRGSIIDAERRLIMTTEGRIIRFNYNLGPYSHH